jgi:hypothetical protein
MKPYLLFLFAWTLAATTSAAEQRIACPARLEPDAIQSNHVPSHWELHMPRLVYLTEGGMLHGPPDESAYLVPDRSSDNKTGKQILQSQHWSFDVPHGYTMWMYCGYGSGVTLKLFRKVAESATECTLTSKANDARIKDEVDFVCK